MVEQKTFSIEYTPMSRLDRAAELSQEVTSDRALLQVTWLLLN